MVALPPDGFTCHISVFLVVVASNSAGFPSSPIFVLANAYWSLCIPASTWIQMKFHPNPSGLCHRNLFSYSSYSILAENPLIEAISLRGPRAHLLALSLRILKVFLSSVILGLSNSDPRLHFYRCNIWRRWLAYNFIKTYSERFIH
jgi:hypothetical protein